MKYRLCKNDANKSFEELVQEIEYQFKQENIEKFILDIRDNIGGNSSIIEPFCHLVKDNNLEGVVLINKKVFSSGPIAA